MDWKTILFGAFGIAIVQIGWEAIKYFITRYDERQKKSQKTFNNAQQKIEFLYQRILQGVVDIQEQIDEFRNNVGATRVVVYKLHNGGGIPHLGSEQRISILNESTKTQPLRDDIQNFKIDSPYQRILLNMMTNGIEYLNIVSLDSGLFKTMATGANTESIALVHVTNIPDVADPKKGFMVYLSIEFEKFNSMDSKFESKCHILTEKIRNIFNNFYA